MRLVDHVDAFRNKCNSLIQIKQYIKANLEYFPKIPVDQQTNNANHNEGHNIDNTEDMNKLKDLGEPNFSLDDKQIVLDEMQHDQEFQEDFGNALESKRNEVMQKLQENILIEDEKEMDIMSQRKDTQKYVAKVLEQEQKMENEEQKGDVVDNFDYQESEICSVGDVDYEQIDIPPFNIELFASFNQKLLKGDVLINVSATTIIFEIFQKIIKNIDEHIMKLIKKKEIESVDVMLFVIPYKKLELAEYLLYSAFKARYDSLFYQQQTTKDWKLLKTIYTEVDIKNPKQYLKDIKGMISNMALGGAMLTQGMKSNNSFSRFFRAIGYSTYYLAAKKDRTNQYQYFIANPNKEHLGKMFLMPDSQFVKNMYKINIPKILLKQKIYVPMLTKKLKVEEAQSYEREDLRPNNFQMPISNQTVERNFKDPSYITDKKLFVQQKMVKIRINSSIPLDVDFKTRKVKEIAIPKHQHIGCCLCFFSQRKLSKPMQRIDKIIIHIHGGGFVTTDSCLHQNYTRLWSNDLGVPVFSIDYSLAPKSPFPEPVNDCFQAYYWIMTQAKHQLGIDPQNVVLTGDSAGGHLVCAVVILAILRGFQLPTSIVLHYPALMLDLNSFFPSTLIALDDPILSTAFPPTRIMICESDPLRDPSYEFALKLKKNNVDVKLILMKDYIHGFDELDIKGGIKECRNATLITEDIFREFLDLEKPTRGK
ncbi:hormone sensitive [Stylonychia lemnae]|uniref:Hormone sensitive n=1 Tax=Stylonychia lemnae TaxID=5949 RepID=A0A077ZSX2_STYLE|nr:hormone sensitive [Stylonychia lemnae]|eukprot:CDW72983.1 hormone sensitive [Stylonychia lemnae]